METYQNLSGNSGVAAYNIGDNWIEVQFTDGGVYLYTAESVGAENIEQMKILAREGVGLNTFINRKVKGLLDRGAEDEDRQDR